MDLDNQTTIKQLVDAHGTENLVVVLGMNGEGVRVAAETVTSGDPSWAGPLAGVSLGLPVYHILEEQVRTKLPADLYAEKVQLMEMVLDVGQIEDALAELRRNQARRG